MKRKTVSKFAALVAVLSFCIGCGENSANNIAIENDTQSESIEYESNLQTEVQIDTQEEQQLNYIDAWGEWHETTIRDDVRKHPYDWSYLKHADDDISYEGDLAYTIQKGIDVSYHQGNIDWKQVKNAGYDFAFIRLAYRGYGQEGNLCLDSKALDYITQAHDAGMEVGVYVFSQAINEEEALEEAQFVIAHLQGYSLELPIVYDPELIRDDEARTDHVTGEQFTENTRIFCEKIKEAGYQPAIYSNMIWEADLFDLSKLQEYPIWYADYEKIPQTPYDFEYWQYSESGTVDGINGLVDLDVRFCKN